MSTYGFVYILVNECMPDVYKVGCTERSPQARAEEISKPTGVPVPFEVLCYAEFANFQAIERDMHDWLNKHRISPAREFFRGGLGYAVRLLWWHPERLSFGSSGAPGGKFFHARVMRLADFPFVEGLHESENPWPAARDAVTPAQLHVVEGGA